MKNTTDVLLYAKIVIILKNTKTLNTVGIVRIELTKDQHNPFSSKELLERQDCCESTLFYTSFDSVSLPPRNSQIKLVKPLRLLLGQHFTHLLCFRSLLRFYKLLSIPLCTLESLTSIETLLIKLWSPWDLNPRVLFIFPM
jgi:hypothetical protein